MKTIHTSILYLTFITIMLFTACKKYERDNPNDLLGITEGSNNIAFNEFKITDDVSGDGKLQKFETGKLWLSFKNLGGKISSQITKVELSAVGDIVVFGTDPIILKDRIMVDKQEYNLKVDFFVPDIPNPSNKTEATANISFIDGTTAKVKFNIDITPTKASKLSIKSAYLRGYNEVDNTYSPYQKGLTPILVLTLTNNSSTAYQGKLNLGMLHIGSQYAYENHSELNDVNLAAGQTGTYNVNVGCFPVELPDNYSSPSQINIYDKDSGWVQGSTTFNHSQGPYYDFNVDFYPFNSIIEVGKPFSIDVVCLNNESFPLYFLQEGANAKIGTGSTGAKLENVRVELLESKLLPYPNNGQFLYRLTGVLTRIPTSDDGYVFVDLNLPFSIGHGCPLGRQLENTLYISYKK